MEAGRLDGVELQKPVVAGHPVGWHFAGSCSCLCIWVGGKDREMACASSFVLG